MIEALNWFPVTFQSGKPDVMLFLFSCTAIKMAAYYHSVPTGRFCISITIC